MVAVGAHAQPAFSWRTRVYWEDTDAGGVVYHAAYLRFMERARSEWMRACGLGQQALRERFGVVFVVRELDIDFDKPGRLDDELDATLCLARVRGASFDLAQTIVRAADTVTLARADVRIACVDAGHFTPARIPSDVAALIEQGTLQA
jgi:acyl-CoA thioester hydrolase